MCLILTTGRREGDADSGDLGYYFTFSAYLIYFVYYCGESEKSFGSIEDTWTIVISETDKSLDLGVTIQ